MDLELRLATVDDVPGMARSMAEGFASYRSFAPPGYDPPTEAMEVQRTRDRLARPDAWALVAVDVTGEQAGHVSLLRDDDEEASCAYLWQLFVRASHHGTGLAVTLHAEFLAAARERGYTRARLRTPAGQARARRFYEREGWVADPGPEFEPGLGMDLVVYRRAGLDSSVSPAGVRS